jgi:hypothetical protein
MKQANKSLRKKTKMRSKLLDILAHLLITKGGF